MTMGISFYELTPRASSSEKVNERKQQYGPKTSSFLNSFEDSQLYMSCSKLVDTVHSIQGAKILIRISLGNNVRNVEPQKMWHNFVVKEISNFLRSKQAADKCTARVSLHIERILAMVVMRARPYQQSVQFVEGINMMEATAVSRNYPTVRRHLLIRKESHVPPACPSYSMLNNGLPRYHGVAVLCAKYGTVNSFQFTPKQDLTAEGKRQ